MFTRKNIKSDVLPKHFYIAHELCFFIHDLMVQIIKSGEEYDVFTTEINFNGDEDRIDFERADDIFDWLSTNERLTDRARVLKAVVLPAILSDMLHCVFESLKSSQKGKLAVSYMLIRKPLQESLFVLESIVLDEYDFAQKLYDDPLKLRPHNAGGVEGHELRIEKVLELINESNRFDAHYIAQLRYDKSQEDSFDGICNHAMHLFTQHKAIKTEQLNINFIFSGWQQKETQWAYLYSRLPYLLLYILQIVEYILKDIVLTPQHYIDKVERKLAKKMVLWWQKIDDNYKTIPLEHFVDETEKGVKSVGLKFV